MPHLVYGHVHGTGRHRSRRNPAPRASVLRIVHDDEDLIEVGGVRKRDRLHRPRVDAQEAVDIRAIEESAQCRVARSTSCAIVGATLIGDHMNEAHVEEVFVCSEE
jgi:hypothetical protein